MNLHIVKNIIVTACFLAGCLNGFCQPLFNFNSGETVGKDYYAELPFEYLNGKVIITVNINDKPRRFLLDTGAPSLITEKLGTEIGLEISRKIYVGDQSGKQDSVKAAILPSMHLGGVEFINTPVLIVDQPMIFDCMELDGFIGSNQLRNSVVRFSFKDRRIILTDQPDRISGPAGESTDMYLTLSQSLPFIWIGLKGKRRGREQVLFDSGMNGFYDLSHRSYEIFKKRKIFKKLGEGVGGNSVGLFGHAQSRLHYKLLLEHMEICKYHFEDISVITTGDNNSRLGSQLIEHGVVTLDFMHRKFYFHPFSVAEVASIRTNNYPFQLTINSDNRLGIGFVWNDRQLPGVRPGDEIWSVNGEMMDRYSLCDLMKKELKFFTLPSLELVIRHSDGKLQKFVVYPE